MEQHDNEKCLRNIKDIYEALDDMGICNLTEDMHQALLVIRTETTKLKDDIQTQLKIIQSNRIKQLKLSKRGTL